jgi:hypothetical protein
MTVSQHDTFLVEELLTPRPPPVGCPQLLIQYIRSYPPYWRPFLYPKPEDVPCRGDRDPLTKVEFYITNYYYNKVVIVKKYINI